MGEQKEHEPVLIRTEAYSPAINKQVFDDEHVEYVCTWPGCGYRGTIPSIGSHYRTHSGKAAQRRRGERPALTGDFNEMVNIVFAVVDQLDKLVDKMAAIEETYTAAIEASDKLEKLREALK